MAWGLRIFELKKQKGKNAEAMFARGRNEKKNYKPCNNCTGSKSQEKTKRCYHCHKEGHIRRNCYELKNKRKVEAKKEEKIHNVNVT